MLGKLVKYDLKYGYKIILIVHAILLFACILGRFILNGVDFNAPTEALGASLAIFITFFTLLLVGASFATCAVITVRFYKNLFTDEGYLTWTLPATPLVQLWSKIISGTIWCIADILLCFLGLIILVTGNNVTSLYVQIAPEMTEALGMPLSSFALYLCLFTLFSTVASVIMIYVSVAIGQLFPGHRILCSIIAYFVLTFVIQMFSFIFMILFGLFPNANNVLIGDTAAHYLFSSIGLDVFLVTITAIPEYIATYYIMKKKINLI